MKGSKQFTLKGLFKSKLANLKPTPVATLFWSGSHTLSRNPPVLIISRPGTTQLGTAPMHHHLLKLFKPDNLKPVHPALLVPSHRNSVCLLINLGTSLCDIM